MPAGFTRTAAAVPLAAALLALASCGPSGDEFAPACPRPAILSDAADLSVYRSAQGGDLTDLVVGGRITDISGKCAPGDRKNTVKAAATITMRLSRGPALQGQQVQIPYFVAVTEGDRILDKQVYQTGAAFPANTDQITVTTQAVDLLLPVSPAKSAAAYTILVGFQLTPDQLEANRRRGAR